MPAACVQAWIDKHQGKHICRCGCEEVIPIIRRHKYESVPKFKHYHSPIDKWMRKHRDKHFCRCGCNEPIIVARGHKRSGIPKYKKLHYRPSKPVIDKWVEANQGKHICACGCSQPIKIIRDHKSNGIAKFIHGHSKGLPLDIWVQREQGKHQCVCGCGGDIPISREHRRHGLPKFILGHNCQGVSNPAWCGGLSKTYADRRRAIVPTHWREQVLIRDEFQCAFECPKDSPGPLHAHHIIGFAKQPELADKLWNGITLCEACHYSIKGSEAEHETFFFNILSEA